MTLFDLATLAAMIGTGYFCGRLLASYLGLVGWPVGFVIAFPLPMFGRYLIRYVLERWPSHPPCNKERCASNDYMVVEVREDGAMTFRCKKCGKTYLQDLPYFKEMLPDGSVQPYMKKNALGNWKRDPSEGMGASRKH